MHYTLDINPRPFKAIQARTKTVEGRSLTEWDQTPYEKVKQGDTIEFVNNVTHEHLVVEVRFIHPYPDVRSMLASEGVENVLSSEPKTIEYGIESYNAIPEYKEAIKKFGIYAIGVKKL